MEIKKVRVHTCNQKSEGFIEGKCRCRKFVSHEKASELIDNGTAASIIVSFKRIEVKRVCPICNGLDNFKRRCHLCSSTGLVSEPEILYTYGEDIYMRPFLETPRTATIEEEHIEYAYIKGDRDAIKRIDLYNGLNKVALAQLGAAIIDKRTGEVLFEGTPEPKDDPKKGEGRTHDYGRSI